MAHVSHRLKGAFEGALAGGGDPATSPLYVFGPFLRLLVASGAGAVAFGTPIWMVVATVVVVSLMYRHVMAWIPDGSGGSGLCEEEFGGWAVKVNAAITAIEYTLTFLVSLAALVTFVADRVGGLGHWARIGLAVGLTVLVGVVVNRGPRLAARVFGPATAAVLALLWLLVFATVAQRGLHVPSFTLEAFTASNLHVTFGGYVRLLALMTGIEVFANLVAAYDGPPAERARKAFGSLLIVMVTTLVTMVVVGPAIFELADPMRQDVSVFTQTMDRLLPAPVAYAGTLVGIVVLLSAAAASAQGLQNLSLGLRHRHYVPAHFGQRNRFDVADRPVLIQVLVVSACFMAFGTHEETYLALYAAGVFVLLGLTGWASVKRLVRERRNGKASWPTIIGTVLAAIVTSGAAALIFFERFLDGAWAYLVLVPLVYAGFSHFRRRLGAPTPIEERLGRMLSEQKSFVPIASTAWPRAALAVLDGSQASESAALAGAHVAGAFSIPWGIALLGRPADRADAYQSVLQGALQPERGVRACADQVELASLADAGGFDLLIAARRLPEARVLARTSNKPILIVHGEAEAGNRYPEFARVIVGLDGSIDAEAVLPVVTRFMKSGAKAIVVSVPDGDISESTLRAYAERVADALKPHGDVEVQVGGSGPARTLVEKAKDDPADLVIVASHGRGGRDRASHVPLGSVPERLFSELNCSMLVIPVPAMEAAAPEVAA
ncbi:MAG: universal stress protein [Polyangiaceae bacterium]|nr:universal stress protein [Polyangiaceae bacterium]MBK8941344.1 universal stress protein [Polyangiaceae bacterium]